jgi:hypothetical protein
MKYLAFQEQSSQKINIEPHLEPFISYWRTDMPREKSSSD